MKGPAEELNPITLEVVEASFVNITREMTATLIKTSYSPILYETHDFSCGLVDNKAQLIGLSTGLPYHIFPTVTQAGVILEKFGDDIHPNDIFITNDPYTGGTHLNDVTVVLPYFFDGKFSAIIPIRAHFVDVGGMTPGSASGKATEIYQEGIWIPPVKICEGGKTNKALMEVIFNNMRMSNEREGDYLAMLDTARTGKVRLDELMTKYGRETIERCITALLDRSERRMRQAISQLTPGVYYYEAYMESIGLSAEPVPVRAKMEVKGDSITVDYTGTARQVLGPVNGGLAMGPAFFYVILKSFLDPLTPVNSGCFRPIKFINPKGTVINATHPAAMGGGPLILQAVAVGLLSQAMPQPLIGMGKSGRSDIYSGGWDPLRRKEYVWYEYPRGGTAAWYEGDGNHCVCSFYDGDMRCYHPAETLENQQPVRAEAVELRVDSEGAGYRRGGLGMIRRVTELGQNARLSQLAEDAIIPAISVSGGYSGARNSWTLLRKDKYIPLSDVPGKLSGLPLEYGDVIEIKSLGGSGYGDPLTREVELVRQDVLDEYISEDRAREAYGVVMVGGEVDLAKTEELRDQLRKQRVYLKVIARDDDEYDKIGCRLCLLGNQLANQLGVTTGDLVEYVARKGAPLRAWVKVVADLPGEESPLGPIGRSILKAKEGDMVEIRALGARRGSKKD